MFDNLFNSPSIDAFTTEQFLICLSCALLIGTILSFAYAHYNECTSGFVATVAMIPAVVTVIIIAVSDSIGTGIAVAGAFSLVKFRSMPGTAKEIGVIFLAMGAGLLIGTGYVGYAMLFVVIVGLFYVVYTLVSPGGGKEEVHHLLSITIPEDLDYSGVFDGILTEYTLAYRLTRVKTTNMGSMFRISYDVRMKNGSDIKRMIDEIRCRNGNLEVSVSDMKDDWQTL